MIKKSICLVAVSAIIYSVGTTSMDDRGRLGQATESASRSYTANDL